LAFAAKHHDQAVRRGTRAPYLTQPANVALILTRYGQDERTVIAGILFDVVDDYRRDGAVREALNERMGDKFGADTLDLMLSVTRRRFTDDGEELSPAERNLDLLTRLPEASDDALWVCAAYHLHNAASLAADLRRTMDQGAIWSREPGGREATIAWYADVLSALSRGGFNAPIMDELRTAVAQLSA
jgi:(p)ppGpp synthase/HD superfamily hydrolase